MIKSFPVMRGILVLFVGWYSTTRTIHCQAFTVVSIPTSHRLLNTNNYNSFHQQKKSRQHQHLNISKRKLYSIKSSKEDTAVVSSPDESSRVGMGNPNIVDNRNAAGSIPTVSDSPSDSALYSTDVGNDNNNNNNEDDKKMGIWAARALLLLVAILWGTNFASVKYLETLCFHPPCNHPPSEAALARFGVAALVSIPLLVGQKKEIILAGLECGLWITLGYITQAMALQSIPSGTCAFICSLTVVVVPLISAFFGKPLKASNLLSAMVALAGVGVLEGLIDVTSFIPPALADVSATNDVVQAVAEAATTSSSSLLLSSSASSLSTLTEASAAANAGALGSLANMIGVTKGDLLALGQPVGFGLSFMRIEHYVEKFEDDENRVLTIAAAECVAVGFCSLLWVLYDFHGTIPNFGYMMEWHRIVAISWTGIVTTVVAIYFEGFALQVASATDAALTFASEPVWASLFGAWLLREKLGPTSYIGGAIILLGCVLGAVGDLPSSSKEDDKDTD